MIEQEGERVRKTETKLFSKLRNDNKKDKQ
jgi:hypothetical protein